MIETMPYVKGTATALSLYDLCVKCILSIL
jgi:hypothetical protein